MMEAGIVQAGFDSSTEALDAIAAALRVQLDGPPPGSSWPDGRDSDPAIGWVGTG